MKITFEVTCFRVPSQDRITCEQWNIRVSPNRDVFLKSYDYGGKVDLLGLLESRKKNVGTSIFFRDN